MSLRLALAGTAVALVPLSDALAQTPPPDTAALLQRLEEAEQRLQGLVRAAAGRS